MSAMDPLRELIAERGAVPRAEVAERGLRRAAVRGRGQDGVRAVREGDHPDPVALGQPVEEAADHALRHGEPARWHVGRDHRARRVHREHDRRLLLRHRDHRVRPGEADRERGERDERERGGEVAQPAGPAADEVRVQGRRREGRRLPFPPPLEQDVAGDRERHGDQDQQRGRPVEPHRRPPRLRRC